MKKKIFAVILTTFISLTALQSCDNITDSDGDFQDTQEDGSEGVQLDENFIMQEQTDKLVVHAMSMTTFTLTPAVNIFKEMYPDVDVEIITFNDGEYETILQTELAGGKGPDLIFSFGIDLPDIYKTMLTEIFVDLNQFIGRDDEFDLDDYVKGVLDAGMFKGKRYIMPVEYSIPILTTTQEILDEVGISSEDIGTFGGFLKAVQKYNEKYKDNPDKSVFSIGGNKRYLRSFLMYSGIDLIDYETNTVTIDKTEFKNMMDVLKAIYIPEGDSDNMSIQFGGDANLINQSYLFNNYYTKTDYMLLGERDWIRRENLTHMVFTFPDITGGMVAEVQSFAAIPQASRNQVNAYNLMKIILSEEIQGGNDDLGLNYLRIGNPVLKSAVRSKIEQDSRGIENFDKETINEYADLMMNVDSAIVMPPVIWKLVWEEMTPYFKGTRSFDDCYERLVSKLEIYISE